jgi:hypothetical protein
MCCCFPFVCSRICFDTETINAGFVDVIEVLDEAASKWSKAIDKNESIRQAQSDKTLLVGSDKESPADRSITPISVLETVRHLSFQFASVTILHWKITLFILVVASVFFWCRHRRNFG